METSLAIFALVGLTSAASAGIRVETYGSAAPPRLVGGIPVDPAPFDDRIFSDVTFVPLGLPSSVDFSSPVSVRQIGLGWATWSHGYTGNVYYTNGLTSLTMYLSGWAGAVFQFYAEPNPFGVFQMTATASDGSSTTTSQQFPDGSAGAMGWGFYRDTGGVWIESVRVSSDVDFAIGEFASFPAPASLGLFALAGLVAGRRRR